MWGIIMIDVFLTIFAGFVGFPLFVEFLAAGCIFALVLMIARIARGEPF